MSYVQNQDTEPGFICERLEEEVVDSPFAVVAYFIGTQSCPSSLGSYHK